jgi:hypothetical protein
MITIMLTFIITNLTNGTAPYNITMPTNPANFPDLILQNYPWFFPFITLFLFGISAYLINMKANIDTRTNILAIGLAYTILTYVEVASSLTTFGWFATFEIITISILILITLFTQQGEA